MNRRRRGTHDTSELRVGRRLAVGVRYSQWLPVEVLVFPGPRMERNMSKIHTLPWLVLLNVPWLFGVSK